MNELDRNQVHFITGITIAMDHEDGVLILGMLSDTPFSDNQAEAQTKEPISNFALTRQKAKFLREKLDEFLRESE